MDTLLDRYVISGGITMVPLVICSLLTLGGVFQGLLRYRRSRVISPHLLAQARQIASPARRRPFVMGLRAHASPLGRAVWFALKDFASRDHDPDLGEIDALVEEATEQAAEEMYDGLGMLATIYTIAPLLGLLGTILGMMKTFYEFGVRNEQSIEVLSVGIQEALVTTLWGLAIAIFAYVAAQWFQARIRRYERQELPVAAREIIATLYSAPAEPLDETPPVEVRA